MKIPKDAHIIDNTKTCHDLEHDFPISTKRMIKYMHVPHILIIWNEIIDVIVQITETDFLFSNYNYYTINEYKNRYMNVSDNICKNLSELWEDMEILSLSFDVHFNTLQQHNLNEAVYILPWDLINKWQRKYIIYGHGVPKQTYEPMNIDNLIDCLRQLFPEYIKPLFVKTKFFMIITALTRCRLNFVSVQIYYH